MKGKETDKMGQLQFKNIIWAVDAFEKPESQSPILAALRAFHASTGARVEPVSVVSRDEFHDAAKARLGELARRAELPCFEEATVLSDLSGSVRGAVGRLTEYARNTGADAILVATHARKGISRLFLGSFAETLLLQSPVPVITVNPETAAPARLEHLLFPTDFRWPARRTFEQTVGFAAAIGARLTLYYKEPLLIPPPDLVSPQLFEFLEQEAVERRALSEVWSGWAKHRGVATTAVLDEDRGDVPRAITGYAEEHGTDLICLLSEAGPVSSVVVGSVARQVIRSARCPVWVRRG